MSGATHYPVFLDLRGRTCVVLGDGPLAAEKAAGLRAVGAAVVHHRRGFRAGDLRGAHLAIDASGDPVAQEAARREADRQRVLLNVVDVAPRCDWIAPAVVRRGPLQIAISTSGESPFLAATVRERLERLFGEEWGPFTALMGRMRRSLRLHGVSGDRQQDAFRRLLRSDAGSLLAAAAPGVAEARAAAIETAVLRPEPVTAIGEVVLVGAGPGDAGLITVAGREALMNADVVLHDSLIGAELLELCRAHARVVDVGKRSGRPSTPQDEITARLIDEARRGNFVVRLKGGDPFLFGRGGEEVAALVAHGVPVRVIPGVSSALAAPAAAGIPVTHRGIAASVAIVSGHRADGVNSAVERLAAAADTLVVLMPGDLAPLAARLAGSLGAGRPAAVVSGATSVGQRVIRAPLGDIARAARAVGATAPVTLVVGDVVSVLAEASPPGPLTATG